MAVTDFDAVSPHRELDPTMATVAPIHPAAQLFPPLDAAAFGRLVADIKAHGIREPGWRDCRGRILDGRHRAAACTQLGVDMPWRTYQGAPGTEVALIVSLNLHRRHLTEDQRAAIAAELANMRQGERTDLSPDGGRLSQAEAAAALQVPVRRVQRAAVVKKLDPHLHEQVKVGKVKLREATKQIAHRRKSKSKRAKQKGTKTAHPSVVAILAALPALDLAALRRLQAGVEKVIAQRTGVGVQE